MWADHDAALFIVQRYRPRYVKARMAHDVGSDVWLAADLPREARERFRSASGAA
jgi:hypothetical protein